MNYLADVKKFKDALLKSDIGRQVSKIIWFGSTVKKKATKDSDVDLLIITEDGEGTKDRIADILLDFQMTNRCPVEIVTSNIDDLYPVIDYFLQNVLAHGQEVYSMPEKDLRRSAANHYLSLSQEFFDSAKEAIDRGHFRLGLDGAYNAAELAVKGFLVLKISDLPGSHGGLVQRFGEAYVKPGTVDRAIGRNLNRCLELRNAARYKFTAKISKEEAGLTLALAKGLIELLEKKLIK